MVDQKQYPRNSKSGDYAITGESSNGINLSKDGNNFLYSGNDEEYLEAIRKGEIPNNGKIDINDPNFVGSYIGMFIAGESNVDLGNKTQQSLDINNTTSEKKEIITPISTPAISVLPNSEPIITSTPTPTPLPTTIIEEESSLLIEYNFEQIPEETSEEFDTIQVDNNFQDKVPNNTSLSLVNPVYASNSVKQNGGKVPKDGTNFFKYGSSFKLIQKDNTLGNQYYYPCALFNQGDPNWGGKSNGKLNLKGYGCAYTSFSMISTYHKNNAGYTPLWFWNNAVSSVVVYWSIMAKSVGLSSKSPITTISTLSIDNVLKSKPLMFEWVNSRASKTEYYNTFTRGKQHWMVINGRNIDGTYTVFDPSGGKIWKNVSKYQIEAGLNRIFYF